MNTKHLAIVLVLAAAMPVFAQDAPAEPPPPPWTTSLGAGLAMTSGNSDTQSLNISFNSTWDPKTDRTFKAEAIYLRGEADGEKTVDKAAAGARYDRSLSERTFLFTEVSALRDPFKEIDYFVSPLVGAGWFALKDDVHFLRFDGAVGGYLEKNHILGTDSGGAFKAGQGYERKLSATSSVVQQLSGIWKVDDIDDASYHFAAGLTTAVTAASELKLAYVYDYRNRVASPDIEKGDSAFVAALLFKF
jgi:putative salt-induced outer membrane protein YdiY